MTSGNLSISSPTHKGSNIVEIKQDNVCEVLISTMPGTKHSIKRYQRWRWWQWHEAYRTARRKDGPLDPLLTLSASRTVSLMSSSLCLSKWGLPEGPWWHQRLIYAATIERVLLNARCWIRGGARKMTKKWYFPQRRLTNHCSKTVAIKDLCGHYSRMQMGGVPLLEDSERGSWRNYPILFHFSRPRKAERRQYRRGK